MLRTIISSCPEFEITCAILNDCLSKLLSRESQREYWGCLGGYLALRRVDFGFYKRYQVMRRTVGTVEVCHRGRYSLEDEELKAVYFPILTRYVDFDIPRRWHAYRYFKFFRSDDAKTLMGLSIVMATTHGFQLDTNIKLWNCAMKSILQHPSRILHYMAYL